ncbi:MAG: endonuclease [Yoonia sp.]
MGKPPSRQSQIIQAVFFDQYKPGAGSIKFSREDLFDACKTHGINPLKNMGDGAVYSYRYRAKFPEAILATQPQGMEWVILGRGIAKYEFRLVSASNILPNPNLLAVKLPEATPEIIKRYAFTDEQALLARIRYNRMVDTFFGITTYSLQNHLRTTVGEIGQIEIDEIYVGVDRNGRHYIIPAQAKVGNDKIGYAQLYQDLAYCAEKYPNLVCRALAAKFMNEGTIALFELTISGDSVRIVQEKHYDLVPAAGISEVELIEYNDRSMSS